MDQHRDRPDIIIEPMSQPPPPPSASASASASASETSFPILAISILGIIATAILLLSYYVFVIKCCLNWHRYDVIRRLSPSQRRWQNPNRHPLASTYSSTTIQRGLNESVIRAIPTFQFQRGSEKQCSFHECAVCLNEFQGEERIRLLPNCFHVFHIDCIDTWLQTHANCPLCRAEITSTIPIPVMKPNLDEGRSVTIDVRDERTTSTVNPAATATATNNYNSSGGRKERKLHMMSSMGDEYINVRGKDEEFAVEPMRRSLSMGSSSDRQMYMAVQEILRKNAHFQEVGSGEGTSGGGSERSRRPFFSFGGGHCRNSRGADFFLSKMSSHV